jgi:hypothetical protein
MAHRCKQVERAIDQGKCAEHDGHGQQSRLWHPEREGCKINAKTPRSTKSHQFWLSEHSALVGSSALELAMVSVFMQYLLKIYTK